MPLSILINFIKLTISLLRFCVDGLNTSVLRELERGLILGKISKRIQHLGRAQ
jgi:hypothetical protein